MRLAAALLALLLGSWAAPAAAQPFPNRPVRMLVGFAPGGGTDITARVLAPRLSVLLGQPVLVENRPGAGGNLATEAVTRAVPDGHTLLMGTIAALAVNPSLYRSLPFDPLTDLAPVGLTVTTHDVLVVHPSLPVRSVAELLGHARAHPGTVCGSSGVGTAGHLSCALFNLLTGAGLAHAPYRGGGPLMNDLLSGQVGVSFSTPATTGPLVRDGRLRGLAVTDIRRLPLLPDLPTMQEAGVAEYESGNWYALVAPRRTPPEVVATLNAALNAALADPEVVAALARQGLDAAPGTPAALATFLRAETEKWGRVMRAAGATAD